MKIKVKFGALLIMSVLLVIPAMADSVTVSRDLPDSATTDTEFTVTLDVVVDGTISGYILSEYIPPEFTVVSYSGNPQESTSNGKTLLKWLAYGSVSSTQYTYTLKTSVPKTYLFEGNVLYVTGDTIEESTGGDTQLEVTGQGCEESWDCTEWSECVDSTGSQTRTCTDTNECGTEYSKPKETQVCGCVPVGTTINLPSITSTRAIDNDGSDGTLLYLYGTYEIDGQSDPMHQLSSETYPQGEQYTFGSPGTYTYGAVITFGSLGYDSNTQQWVIRESGIDSQMQEEYEVCYPEPDTGILQSLLDMLMNLICSLLNSFNFGFCG